MAIGASLAFIAAASSPALADQVRRNEWWLRTLHVTNAWETTRGSGVTIAVLDTGVDPAQADLTRSVTTGPDYTNSGRTAGGQFWGIHGTEVASLIAGHGHGPGQANGIIGIAPAAKILSVRVTLESNDPSLSNQTIAAGLPNAIARGIKWAVQHDASVIDLPLDPVTTSGAPGSGGSSAERAAVNYAIAKHVVLVAPAGDGGAGTDPMNYPAAYRRVIAVGAFDQHFIKATFSSHQPYVLVTAAGAGVTAAGPSGSYPQLDSTSAASAMVAGIVALIQAQFPTLTPAQITHAITSSTVYHRPGGRADGSGFGTADAAKALIAAAGIAETVSKSAASGTAGQAPPTPPAGHSSPIHRNIRGTLIKDAIIAGVVFLLLLGLIFAITAWRRRNARSARLAEVRAAVQPPMRKPTVAKSAARGSAKKGAMAGAQAGASGPDAEAAEPQLEPTGFIPAPLGPVAGGLGASGFTGSASSGFTGSAAGFTGSGFTGSGSGFTGSGFTGSAAGFAGSGFTGSASSASAGFAAAGPTSRGSGGLAALGTAGISQPGGSSPPAGFEPVAGGSPPAGFEPVPGSSPPAGFEPVAESSPPRGFEPVAGSGPSAGPGAAGISLPGGINPPPGVAPTAGLGPWAASDPSGRLGSSAGLGSPTGPGSSAGLSSSPEPAAQDASPAVEATPDLTQPAGAGTGLPPWAMISRDPAARAAPSAPIPGSAFPGAPAAPPAGGTAGGADPAPGAGAGGVGATRMSSRLTQTPRQPRTPQVSGRPPWEPAAEPNSELPWAQAAAPSRGGAGSLLMPEQVRPELPSWEEMAQDAWPGGPKLAGPHPPTPSSAEPNRQPGREGGRPAGARVVPAAGLVPPQPDSPEQPRRTENRPDHAWNTGAGVEPFRAAAQAEPGPAPGGTGAAAAGNGPLTGAAPSDASPSAVSQPGISPARRPSLALPRRFGSSVGRQEDSAAGAVRGANPVGANPAGGGLAGQVPAGGGLAVPGPAGGGLAGSAAPGSTSAGQNWPGTGASQPPFPPAPRPATEPSLPDTGQPERGPFPRAIKPPTDPGAAATSAWGAGTIGAKPSGGSPIAPAFPEEAGPANGPGPAKDGPPGTGATLPSTAGPGAAKPGAAKAGPAKPEAGRSEEGSTRPKTGVPPWEITDSFLAVPPAGLSATPAPSGPIADQPSNPRGASTWGGGPAAASQPSNPQSVGTWGGGPAAPSQPSNPQSASTWGGRPADSTENFPAVGSGADQPSLPRSNPGDGTESFPPMRPRADLEDAFRLFPPVRGTDNRPPADDQD
ncbi:MAG TPA: S8 family serine peptidase [Streptosporangiaceae bacterium]